MSRQRNEVSLEIIFLFQVPISKVIRLVNSLSGGKFPVRGKRVSERFYYSWNFKKKKERKKKKKERNTSDYLSLIKQITITTTAHHYLQKQRIRFTVIAS